MAVSDKFFDDDDDELEGGDAGESEEASGEDAESANTDTEDTTENASTTGDTSKTEEPPTSGAGKDGKVKDSRTVPLAALEDERRKRQQAERERDEARGGAQNRGGGENTPGNGKAKPKELTEEDAVVDPAGYAKQEAQKVRQEFRLKLYNASEKRARAKYPDKEAFQKYHDAFIEAATADQRLFATMDADDDPVVYAIETGRKYLKAKEMGDPEDFEAKIRADERAKVEAALKRKAPIVKAKDIPPTTAGARNAPESGVGDDDDEDDDESFSSMLGRGRRKK
jgi:hypothetical protein